jgi:hypothetical protein
MRTLLIAFILVFALGVGTTLVFAGVGTAAGIALAIVSLILILLMSVVGAAIAKGVPPHASMLMERPHWRVSKGARYDDGFSDFFNAVVELAPPQSLLGLSGGAWDREIREFISEAAVEIEEDVMSRLALDFQTGASNLAFVPLSESITSRLAELAQNHASIEIANHVCGFTADGSWLEWFDATGDPISITLDIEQANVERFAVRIRGKSERIENPDE